MLKTLNVTTAASMTTGKSKILVEPGALDGAKRYYMTAANAAGLTAVTYNSAITVGNWTELTANGLEITPTSGHTVVRVVEVDSNNKPIAMGDSKIYLGE